MVKEWQLTDEQVKALVNVFAPDWDVSAVECIHSAMTDNRGRVDVRFWYQGEAYRLFGTVPLCLDWRERSMEQYRIEKRARQSAVNGEE